jgi:hypothetical protein
MKKYISFFVAVVSLLMFSSCSNTIYFTKDMRYTLYKSKIPVSNVQFYNSRKIVLKRNLSYAETKVARGEIKFENGQYVEEIIIPKNTPGVAVGTGRNYLNVAFENGRNRDLKFSLNEKDLYQLTPQSWDNDYGKVVYDTLIYFLEPGSDRALLKVKKDNIYNFERKKRVVKGITVGRE